MSRNCFASASADNIKKFSLPRGEFLHNMLWVVNLCFWLLHYWKLLIIKCSMVLSVETTILSDCWSKWFYANLIMLDANLLFTLIVWSDSLGHCFSLGSSQQKTIINAMAVNDEGVMATGGLSLSLAKHKQLIPFIRQEDIVNSCWWWVGHAKMFFVLLFQ